MPKSTEPEVSWLSKIPYFDKIIHVGLYAIFSYLILLSRGLHKLSINKRIIFLVIILGLALGISIEFAQPLVDRSCEFMDAVADFAGLTFGIVAFLFCMKFIDTRN